MTSFPILKTQAVAQFPATKSMQFRNQVLRFVAGDEQRYRDSAGPLHRWIIRLDLLDESEMAALDAFFVANQGQFANFEFTDPWNGQRYANCSLQSDEIQLVFTGEFRGSASMTVVENGG
jgi:Conserved hypothetical protein 2217 (DUF2460)